MLKSFGWSQLLGLSEDKSCYVGTKSMQGSNAEFQKCPPTCQDSVLGPFCFAKPAHCHDIKTFFSVESIWATTWLPLILRRRMLRGWVVTCGMMWKINYRFLKPTKTDFMFSLAFRSNIHQLLWYVVSRCGHYYGWGLSAVRDQPLVMKQTGRCAVCPTSTITLQRQKNVISHSRDSVWT